MGKSAEKTIESVSIRDEYITLGQLLKLKDVIYNGGMSKIYLEDNEVYVNGERETRRGRKLRSGDLVEIPGKGFRII